MAFKESAGFISGKKGARRERRIFRAIFAAGYTAILNDLTSCLRYGDITVAFDKRFLIFEVKNKKQQSERVTRQVNELTNMLRYIHTDRTEELYKIKGDIRRIGLEKSGVYHLDKLNQVISEANSKGNSFVEAEKGVYYFATTQNDTISIIQQKMDITPNKDKLMLTLLDKQTYNGLGYYPLVLSIWNPEAVYRFCVNELNLGVLLDTTIIEEKMRVNNLEWKWIQDDDNFPIQVVNLAPANDQLSHLKLSAHYFNRVIAEFQSLDWFLDEVITFFREGKLESLLEELSEPNITSVDLGEHE